MKKLISTATLTVCFAAAQTHAQTSTADSSTPILEKITVTAIVDRNQATTATKTPTEIMNTPVSIQLVTREILDEQQAIRPRDALKNVSGVQPDFGFGGLRDRSIIRGFATDDFPQGGSYLDGVLQFEATNSLANVERVEVLKGAAAMLFGRIEPGGLINYVTKRPQEESHYSLQQQAGSHDEYRSTLDATGALLPGKLAYRLNAEYIDAKSFRDIVEMNRVFIAPSLTWKVSESTRIEVDYLFQDEDAYDDYGIPAIGDRPARVPQTRFTGEPGQFSSTRVSQGSLSLRHEFNEEWRISAKYSKYRMAGRLRETVLGYLDESSGVGDRWYYDAPNGTSADFATVDVTGRFTTGGLTHTLLVGADAYDRKYHEDGIYVDLYVTSTGLTPSSLDIFDPVYGYDLDAVVAGQPRSAYQPSDDWWGVYLQDQIAIGDRWQALVGLRFDHARSEQSRNFARSPDVITLDEEISPRLGLLYRPRNWLAMYASYARSFNKPNIGVNAADGSALEAQTAEQFELGAKSQAFGDRLQASLSVFDLTKQNIAQPVSPVPGAPYELTGEARSRGLEVDVAGQLGEQWRIVATYTWLDTEFTDDVANSGNRLANAPRHMGSLWTTLDGSILGSPRLTLGAGLFAMGKRYGDAANSFELPSHLRLDATVSYSWPFSASSLEVRLNAENLLDEEYYLSAAARGYASRFGITPGAPRSWLASLRYDF